MTQCRWKKGFCGENGINWCDTRPVYEMPPARGGIKTVQSVSALVINMLQICYFNGANSLPSTQLAIHGTPIYRRVQYRASLCAGVHCIKPRGINDSFIWHLVCSSPSPSRFEESYIFASFFLGGSSLKVKHHKLYFPVRDCHNEFHYTVPWTCHFFLYRSIFRVER